MRREAEAAEKAAVKAAEKARREADAAEMAALKQRRAKRL